LQNNEAIVSKTKLVEYDNRRFWTYDVALNIFLKHLIDAAETTDHGNPAWLANAISSWRLACVPDFSLTLDTDLSSAQLQTFLALAEKACAKLAERESISSDEVGSWEVLEGVSLYTRGATEVMTAPVIELGRAIIELVLGQLPEAPAGQIWLYGAPEGRITIGSGVR
jgi:hypothetical protein